MLVLIYKNNLDHLLIKIYNYIGIISHFKILNDLMT